MVLAIHAQVLIERHFPSLTFTSAMVERSLSERLKSILICFSVSALSWLIALSLLALAEEIFKPRCSSNKPTIGSTFLATARVANEDRETSFVQLEPM